MRGTPRAKFPLQLKHRFGWQVALDLGQRFFRLHDTIRHFLRDRAGKERLIAQQKALVAALEGAVNAGADERTRRYFYRGLPHHLFEAGEREKLDALLLDPAWLKAKLEATGNTQLLIADYKLYGAGEAQDLIGRTLQLISGICARDPRQLPVQLATRLMGFEEVVATGFVVKTRQLISRYRDLLRSRIRLTERPKGIRLGT